MAEVNLTQMEADSLIGIEKIRGNEQSYTYPEPGVSINIPLISSNKRENFFLDISRGSINLNKRTHQNRARQIVVLLRLDLGGHPHRNPDGSEISSPHLHIYREGFGDKWAFPVPSNSFSNLADPWVVLSDFMRYCNIVELPIIDRGLFI